MASANSWLIGTHPRASSRRPGFSYLVGVADKVIMKFRNFCDSLSCVSGGVGILGRFRSDEYEGGVALDVSPCDVVGRPEDDGVEARRLAEDALSRGDGEPRRERERSSSFRRRVRNKRSKRSRKSRAHSSS